MHVQGAEGAGGRGCTQGAGDARAGSRGCTQSYRFHAVTNGMSVVLAGGFHMDVKQLNAACLVSSLVEGIELCVT